LLSQKPGPGPLGGLAGLLGAGESLPGAAPLGDEPGAEFGFVFGAVFGGGGVVFGAGLGLVLGVVVFGLVVFGVFGVLPFGLFGLGVVPFGFSTPGVVWLGLVPLGLVAPGLVEPGLWGDWLVPGVAAPGWLLCPADPELPEPPAGAPPLGLD
jgi:GLTT repeat (6 copies)